MTDNASQPRPFNSTPAMPVGQIMASNLLFETAAARRALSESRAEEAIRNVRLFTLSSKIHFHARRGMSRATLERIYGREIVLNVLGSSGSGQSISTSGEG